MALYQVITVPNEVLRAKAQPVTKINAAVLRVLDNMRDTLYAFEGIGLAAPQIGVSKRMIVIDIGDNLIELINPEIVHREGKQVNTEGCLSVPGIAGSVTRSRYLTVKGLNRDGKEVTYEVRDSGLLATVFQHEIDHLDGILFTDRANETWEDSPRNRRG